MPDRAVRCLAQCLWLNDNCLSKLVGLGQNFRLRELYLQNNQITTLCNASCCLPELRHLELLQLAGNLLQDLRGSLAVLSRLSLKHLNLRGNPLTAESNYRLAVVAELPGLEIFDCAAVTDAERAAARPRPASRKKYGFGSVVKPWEKPAAIPRGAPSATEVVLQGAVHQTLRRREREGRAAAAAAFRDAARPSFDLTYTDADGRVGTCSHEFVPKGRVPCIQLSAGALRLTPDAGSALATPRGHVAGEECVHVVFNALRLGSRRSRSVSRRHASGGASADLRFNAELVDARGATTYTHVLQLMSAAASSGDDSRLAVSATLIDESRGRAVLGTATLPLGDMLLGARADSTVAHTALFAAPADAVRPGATVARLELSLSADWNQKSLQSDYLGARRRRLGEEMRALGVKGSKRAASARVPKDVYSRFAYEFAMPTREEQQWPEPEAGAPIQLDEAKYETFLKMRAPIRLRPLTCTI